jgi:hypothetical protein
MSQDSDVRSTSHDHHDPMLVAALAANDLVGADRDRAIALTHSCAECALLHDDLLALARATAAAPPPIATRPRDFTLTPTDAARLRPNGWRRLVAAASSWRSIASRPLGVGLATIGVVGLLVGNVNIQLSLGGASAGAPLGATTSVQGGAAPAASAGTGASEDAVRGSSKGAASLAPEAANPVSAGQSPASGYVDYGAAIASSLPTDLHLVPIAPPTSGDQAASTAPAAVDVSSRDTGANGPFRPLNLLFGAAIVLGIGLLVVSGLRGRRPA